MFAAPEIYFLMNSIKKKVFRSWIALSKLFINVGLVIIVIINTVTSLNNSSIIHDVDLYSPIIEIGTLVSIIILSLNILFLDINLFSFFYLPFMKGLY